MSQTHPNAEELSVKLNPKQSQEEALRKQAMEVLNAITNPKATFKIKTEMEVFDLDAPDFKSKKEFSLNCYWPTIEDEMRMGERASEISGSSQMVQDIMLARGVAMIEALAAPPFFDADWLPCTSGTVPFRGGNEIRPLPLEAKTRAVIVKLYNEYLEVYNRFQGASA